MLRFLHELCPHEHVDTEIHVYTQMWAGLFLDPGHWVNLKMILQCHKQPGTQMLLSKDPSSKGSQALQASDVDYDANIVST